MGVIIRGRQEGHSQRCDDKTEVRVTHGRENEPRNAGNLARAKKPILP